MNTRTSSTRNTELGYDRVTVTTIDKFGDELIVGWIHRWDGEREWTLISSGETIGKTTKREGMAWLRGKAEGMAW